VTLARVAFAPISATRILFAIIIGLITAVVETAKVVVPLNTTMGEIFGNLVVV
jgi:hypothetical protein